MRLFVLAVITTATIAALTGIAQASEFGTAEEARAMLERVVAAVKLDKAAALADINKGAGGFKDRDLYPFCGGPDGMTTAHPTPTWQQLYRAEGQGRLPGRRGNVQAGSSR